MSIILHHYPLSPYSEKIRAMLAYTDTAWKSCITSEAPPRGDLDILSGGYSRIPIGQIGADIYCDSNLLADEIAALSKTPALANEKLNAEQLEQRQWVESKLFFACVNRAFSISLLSRIAKEKGVLNLGHFLKDRIQMGAKAAISMGSPKSAPKYINQGFNLLTEGMGTNAFIGGNSPNLVDFALYHCFWFLAEVGERDDLNENPQVLDWYQRMHSYQSSPVDEIGIESALSEAKIANPKRLAKRFTQDHRIGADITIAPSDYRQIPVTGKLVGADSQRWIIERNHPETGKLHLHFPTHGVNVVIRLPN